MSLNQSRTEKSEPSQSRKSGRSGSSNQQRNFSGGSGKGGGGVGRGSAPPANQSFKKVNNAQGGQSRVPGATQNGAAPSQPVQQSVQAAMAGPVSSVGVKQSEPVAQRSSRNVPKAPSSNAAAPTTPVKAPGDSSGSFPLQFGSLSPGLMNGMQIPARTSSAPPNLDEQKRDQARNDGPRSNPALPTPSVPKQQLPRKEVGPTSKPTATEIHQPVPKQKRENQAPAAIQPPAAAPPQIQKLPPQVHPIPGIPIQMPPFHHQQPPPVQFAGPTSQGSMPMPMPIPRANPSQQQVYVHQLPGIMHQGANINFSSQMGPPQMSNVNLNMPQNFQSPPQTGQYSGQRKSIVKITHPDTHEELRLDSGSTGQRPHPNLPAQSQPIQSFPSNYYPGPFNPNPLFFQATSLPISSSQVAPGAQNQQRFYTQGPQSAPFANQAARNLFSGGKSAESVQVTVKPAVQSSSISVSAPAVKITASPPVVIKDSASAVVSSSAKSTTVNKPELVHSHQETEVLPTALPTPLPVLSKPSLPAVLAEKTLPSAPSAITTEPSSVAKNVEGVKKEIVDKSDCVKDDDDDDKKINKNEVAATQSTGVSILPTPKLEHSGSLSGQNSKNVETKTTPDSEKLPPSAVSEEHVSNPKSVSTADANEEKKPEILVSEIISPAEETKESDQNSESTRTSTLKSSDPVKGNLDNNTAELLETATEKVEEQAPLESSKEEDEAETLEASSSKVDQVVDEVAVAESEPLDQDSSLSNQTTQDQEYKALPEPNRGKGDSSTVASTKKRRKEALQKANSKGNTSDLYNAYKNPEEKIENATSVSEPVDSKPTPEDTSREDESDEKSSEDNKGEPDDWEDAAEITPKLKTSAKDEDGITGTKYSRDFLMKFCDQFTDLPEGFAITPDFIEAMTSSNFNGNNPREYPSPGRNFDGPRLDRRNSGLTEDDRWNRVPGPLNNVHGYRSGQGGNSGVLRGHPRGGIQTPAHYITGGILTGPMQSGSQRNIPDSDRWQRAKGLIQSPQTPLQVMHRAERKYEIGKVTDEEQAKQRQLKGILNKLTPQNFEKLFEQVKQVNIDNAGTLTGVISQIFDKALMEPTFCEMYADFCFSLSGELPDFVEDNEKITFRRLLLNKCQEEFERGEREQEEANRAEEEGEVKQTEEEREEKRIQARRRMLGNIRLIGELYKKKMLTERIMHECIKKLLGQYQTPDEEDVESLCKLMSTIGVMIDHPKAKEHMDVYFDMMNKLSNNMKLSSRVRFMLKDAIDLRKNKWQQRRKVEGPKKIEEVHRDAAQERHAQTSRLARGGGSHMSQPSRRGPPPNMDYGSRGSNMMSPNSQTGGFRGGPGQMRGYGNNQDIRLDDRVDRHSVTLPQRPLGGDDPITLGPQGGLARGMSSRGQVSGSNGYGDRPGFAQQREDFGQRYGNQERFGGASYEQSNMQERGSYRTVDRGFDRQVVTSPSTQIRPPLLPTQPPAPAAQSEKVLGDKSLIAIKEFYSAKDEKELGLCVKELNDLSFYPSMVALWINDSFERKDMERDSLAKLLVTLSKRDGILTEDHLIQGFKSVLAGLEDAVNDAPKAAEFLGRIFARVIIENVIQLKITEQLIYEGGQEKGELVEIGLAADVLGIVLETIESEKGETAVKEMRSRSNLGLENFRPKGTKKTLRLDKFI